MAEFDDFLDRLGSGDPVPGGGSVAALEAAMAAALLCMVANLTLGRKRFADVHAEAEALRDKAQALGLRARILAEEDVRAFSGVSAAMGLPRETDAEKAARRERLQAALKVAARPPLDVMRLAGEIVSMSSRMAVIGNPSAISDVGTAALTARAAFHAAKLNVEINAAAVHDESWVRELRSELETMGDPDTEEQRIMRDVVAGIRGENG